MKFLNFSGRTEFDEIIYCLPVKNGTSLVLIVLSLLSPLDTITSKLAPSTFCLIINAPESPNAFTVLSSAFSAVETKLSSGSKSFITELSASSI